jgi:4-hydroxybenzoate polyprenyltransferase
LAFRNQTLFGLCFLNDFSCYIYIYIYIYIYFAHLVWYVSIFVGAYLIARVHKRKRESERERESNKIVVNNFVLLSKQ